MTKPLYRIRQVSAMLGVPASTLRFWESEFAQLNPERTESGQRRYSERDLNLCSHIKHLLYDRRISIGKAKETVSATFRSQNPRYGYKCKSKEDAIRLLEEVAKLAGDNPHSVMRVESVVEWLKKNKGE